MLLFRLLSFTLVYLILTIMHIEPKQRGKAGDISMAQKFTIGSYCCAQADYSWRHWGSPEAE